MTFLCTDSCAGRVETTLHSPQGNFEALSNPGARGLLLTWAQCESRARGLRTKVCGKRCNTRAGTGHHPLTL
jgi:hypothetical protein